MDELVNDIMEKKQSSNSYKNNTNTKWKEEQSRKRQQAFSKMEKMSFVVKTNGEMFQKYLDIQSRFNRNSVGNCLIILTDKPNAMQFKDKKSWKELNVNVKAYNEPFTILEPEEKNGRRYFNPKDVFDISQTDSNIPDYKDTHTEEELLAGYLYDCKAEKEVVNKLPDDSIGIKYDSETNKLYICRGMEKTDRFQALGNELANIELRADEENHYKDFKCKCISYMLCKKYNIDVSNYDFTDLPSELQFKDNGTDIRKELDTIRLAYNSINDRIQERFEKGFNSEKNRSTKVQER